MASALDRGRQAQDRGRGPAGAASGIIDRRRYGISRPLLLKWRRSSLREPNGPEGRQTGFVPAAPASGRMVIVVRKDRRVIVDASVDAAALARVLQVLERR